MFCLSNLQAGINNRMMSNTVDIIGQYKLYTHRECLFLLLCAHLTPTLLMLKIVLCLHD